MFDRFGEIGKDQCAFRQGVLPLGDQSFSGEHQYRPGAELRGRVQVAQGITDDVGFAQVGVKAPTDAFEHARLGLAAFAFRIGRMRAIEYGIDAPTGVLHGMVHLVMNGIERVHVEQAATDA